MTSGQWSPWGGLPLQTGHSDLRPAAATAAIPSASVAQLPGVSIGASVQSFCPAFDFVPPGWESTATPKNVAKETGHVRTKTVRIRTETGR